MIFPCQHAGACQPPLLLARILYPCTSVYLIEWTVYLRILRIPHYDIMGGRLVHRSRQKWGLRRQKVNCGPVIFVILFWPFLVYSCVALYPGLLTPPFVACSTNAGGRPGKIESHAVTYLDVWRSTWYIPGNHK